MENKTTRKLLYSSRSPRNHKIEQIYFLKTNTKTCTHTSWTGLLCAGGAARRTVVALAADARAGAAGETLATTVSTRRTAAQNAVCNFVVVKMFK